MSDTVLYLVSQIFITCALLLQGVTYFVNARNRQLIMVIVSNMLSAMCFALLGGYVAVVMNIIAIARDVTCHIMNKLRGEHKLPYSRRLDIMLLGLWMVLLTGGSMMTADGVMSMLPYFSTMIFTVAIWQNNILFYRFAGLITNSLLIAYNIFMFNVMGVFLQTGLLMFAICGFIMYFVTGKLSQDKK